MDAKIVQEGADLAQQLEADPPPPPEWEGWVNRSYTIQEAFDDRGKSINQKKFLHSKPDATPLDILLHGLSRKRYSRKDSDHE